MANNVRPVPDGYHTATPYLRVRDAASAIEFYKKAFGATEIYRMSEPDGKVGHAEIEIGDSRLMISDEYPEMSILGPQSLGGTSITIHLFVEDVDALAEQAVAAGARVLRPVKDEFYGDRQGKLEDPFGHQWSIATRVEDVTPEEMQRRYEALMAQ